MTLEATNIRNESRSYKEHVPVVDEVVGHPGPEKGASNTESLLGFLIIVCVVAIIKSKMLKK